MTNQQSASHRFADAQQPADEMGRTLEELLAWMREVAVARDDYAGKHKTVNLKFTTATLRMWVQRVDDAIALEKQWGQGA